MQINRRAVFTLLFVALLPLLTTGQPQVRVIAFFTPTVERDHVDFAHDVIRFYQNLAVRKNFVFDTTSTWANLNGSFLQRYQVVVWVNEFPHTEEQRRAFENFMSKGGGWIGFHVAGYNDKDTHWPWFVDFMGGAIFYTNNWPPLPATLVVDDRDHPVTRHLPASFLSPTNEWYLWKPSPRLNPSVRVLITLAPSNYPLGKKDIITGGDLPVVWTNTRYRMLYLNMGHGNKVLSDTLQNHMFTDAMIWIGKIK
jgi:type 1 glutamine amidotransferase